MLAAVAGDPAGLAAVPAASQPCPAALWRLLSNRAEEILHYRIINSSILIGYTSLMFHGLYHCSVQERILG